MSILFGRRFDCKKYFMSHQEKWSIDHNQPETDHTQHSVEEWHSEEPDEELGKKPMHWPDPETILY